LIDLCLAHENKISSGSEPRASASGHITVIPNASIKYSGTLADGSIIGVWKGARRSGIWVETWKEAGPDLDRIRQREIQAAEDRKVLALLESAFNNALRTAPPRPSSGLVEMQKWFAKLPR
jgi:hypothetical protein